MKSLLFALAILTSATALSSSHDRNEILEVIEPAERYAGHLNSFSEANCQFELYSNIKYSGEPEQVVKFSFEDLNAKGELLIEDKLGHDIKSTFSNDGDGIKVVTKVNGESYSSITTRNLSGIKVRQSGWLFGFLKLGGVKRVQLNCL